MKHEMMKQYAGSTVTHTLVLVAVAVGMFLTAPTDGAFWWSEAPRNALNGAFIYDLIREMPLDDPIGWAEAYYYQYPALTILFYPPLFHTILAIAFAIFGVSHSTAVLIITAFYLAMMLGTYRLGTYLTNRTWGLILAVLFAGAPEVAVWGRQVMLEIPMMAFAVWSACFVVRFIENNKTSDLFWAAFLSLCAVYTKQTIIFVFPVFAGMVIWFRWRDILADGRKWIVIILAVVAFIPLIVMQLKFGAFNVTSVANRDDVEVGKWTLEGWTWYFRRLPETIGWPATIAVALTPVALLRFPKRSTARVAFVLCGLWALAALVFFNIISLKETRHGIPLYFSLSALGIATIYYLFDRRVGVVIAGLAACYTLISTWAFVPTPALPGYRAAADVVVEQAQSNARVMYVGDSDGHFIFNVRANPKRGQIAVVRADKLFLDIKIMPSFGYGEKDFDRTEISDMLNRYGIEWVVSADNFWTHIPVMNELSELLKSPQFEEFQRIPVNGNVPHIEKVLVVYRNLGELSDPPENYPIQLGAVDRKIEVPD